MDNKKVLFVEGKGFWQGLPARDLTAEEWAEVSPENQKVILATGIYKLADKPTKAELVKEGDK